MGATAVPIVDDDWTALLGDLSARLGLSRRIALLRSDRAAMPMTWGWLRPVVLLPAEADSWGADRRRDVLLHELAHVRRLDCLTQAIARARVRGLLVPPAGLVRRASDADRARARLRRRRAAGRRPGQRLRRPPAGDRPGAARPRAAALAALAMARPSQLEGRLMAILDPARRRRGPGRKAAAIALLAAVLALVPLATLHVGARAAANAGPVAAPIADDPPAADPPARMTVTGRVLDPVGKPVPDAAVMVIVRSKYSDRPLLESTATGAMTAHEGRCDGSGRFRIELPRTTSARQHGLTVTAMAPGYGIGWTELDPDADPPVADVALRPELIVRGRLFDVKGQPAPGVALRIDGSSRSCAGRSRRRSSGPTSTSFAGATSPPGPARRSATTGTLHPARAEPRPAVPLLIEDPRFAIPLTMIQTAENVDARQPSASSPRSRSIPDPIRSRSRSPCSRPGRSPDE